MCVYLYYYHSSRKKLCQEVVFALLIIKTFIFSDCVIMFYILVQENQRLYNLEYKMKIVIAGGGKVGEALCTDLSAEGYDVILIEVIEERLTKLIEKADITGLVGNGASIKAQLEVGVDTSDVFISVTNSDELNIISAIIARKLGAQHTIARVRNPEYFVNMNFVRDELGITFMINPELVSARDIMTMLRFPYAYDVESFFRGVVNIVEVEIEEDSFLNGKMLQDLNTSDEKVLVCIVDRNHEVFIPNGQFVLQAKDRIYLTGSEEAIHEFWCVKKSPNKRVRSVMIVGGSRISHYLIEKLIKKNIKVKLIEINTKIAEEFSFNFPEITVINGDGTDQDLLREEGISSYDAVVSMTGIDEENMILSMFSHSLNVQKTITKINRKMLMPILDKIGLDSVITPKKVISDLIIRFVRSEGSTKSSKVETLHRFLENRVESLEFIIDGNSRALNIPLKDLKTIPNLLIACILREGQLIFPGGQDVILEGDRVLIITTKKYLDRFDEILVS